MKTHHHLKYHPFSFLTIKLSGRCTESFFLAFGLRSSRVNNHVLVKLRSAINQTFTNQSKRCHIDRSVILHSKINQVMCNQGFLYREECVMDQCFCLSHIFRVLQIWRTMSWYHDWCWARPSSVEGYIPFSLWTKSPLHSTPCHDTYVPIRKHSTKIALSYLHVVSTTWQGTTALALFGKDNCSWR